MKFHLLFLSVLIIIFSSCIQIQSKQSKSTSNNDFVFPTRYLSHFPRENEASLILESKLQPYTGSKNNKGAYLKKLYQFSVEDLNLLKDKLQNTSEITIKYSDSCALIINRQNVVLQKNYSIDCDRIIPVPAFVEEIFHYNNEKSKVLPDDFKLYVIQVKKGLVFSEELYSKQNYMPKEWEHGLSRGVAISIQRKQAIFWIDTW